MKSNKKLLTIGALAVLAVLFVAVILVSNTLFRGARLDLTQNHLYTLSQGTKNILSSIEEPVNLTLYFSDKAAAESANPDAAALRNYAPRVREMLAEMAARAGGKLRVTTVDPLPFSEDEDRATTLGLQALPWGQGSSNLFLGIVGTNSTNGKSVMPIANPNKETFLEYDVAKMIHELSMAKKPAVGLISGLPMGAGFDAQTRQMRQPWAIQSQLEQMFEVRTLTAASVKSIDKDINVLVVVQPKNLSDDAQYAIDQFVLRGGHLLVFVDPLAESDDSGADPNNPQAAMMADRSSDLPKLFKAWGVDYDAKKIVLDREHALQVSSAQGQPIRHPAILGFNQRDLNPTDITTAQLQSINVSTAGFFQLAKDSKNKLTPLIQTSADAMTVAADRVKFMTDPSQLLVDYKPDGAQPFVVAGRLEGKFATAFPERKAADHLAESKDGGEIILVADTDILSNRLWVQVQQFFGQQVMNAFANNGDFIVNAVDNLGGSSDLISIRGRATSQRPFTTVDNMRRAAEESFRGKERELQQRLSDTERKLTELQSGKSKENEMILSPEQKAELTNFQDQKIAIRKELRQVRRSLDDRIEALGTRLKLVNIGLMPLLITLFALGFAWARRRARAMR
ncbi:GldG family protein [Rudaea cellulosilytica]|uniref:GldG family protein n=1 Tax=Rudaea cellulosilytica TaxID=540746 RepID=UPI00037AFDF9|nr:Gldg family protein [Rudaea cellulosilytica]